MLYNHPLNGKIFIYLYLLTGGLLGLLIALNWIGIIDDAYIFFRYAHNLSRGLGYTFNPGYPVEGTTSVSWTVLLSILDYFQIPLDIGAKFLGYLSILGCIFVLYFLFFRWSLSIAVVALISVLLITNQQFTQSIMMGLETGLYALLLVALLAATDNSLSNHFSANALGIVGVFLFLTRPESVGILVLLTVGLIVFNPFNNPRISLIPVIWWLAGILLITLWRIGIFGDFIPNSARAKSVISFLSLQWVIIWPRLLSSSIYLVDWFQSSWFLILAGIGGLGYVWQRNRFQGFTALSILLLGCGVVLLNAGDWMPFSRLLTPYLPPLVAMAGLAIHKTILLCREDWRPRLGWLLISLSALIYISTLWQLRNNDIFTATIWPTEICYKKVGIILQSQFSKNTLLAPEAIGAIGYQLPEVPILDMFGLTEPFIARNGVIPKAAYTFGKHNYEYVLGQNPAIFLFHSDVVNHIPYLNKWGYSQDYSTFQLDDGNCQLVVGIRNSYLPGWVNALEQAFRIQPFDTSSLPRSFEATWPLGEK